VRAGRAILVDDPLGKEIVNALAVFRLVSGEQVIEGSVLADDHDDVLDGGLCSPVVIIRAHRYGEQSAEGELKQYDRNQTDSQISQRLGANLLHGILASVGRVDGLNFKSGLRNMRCVYYRVVWRLLIIVN
jgi:hypothetical protein